MDTPLKAQELEPSKGIPVPHVMGTNGLGFTLAQLFGKYSLPQLAK